MTNIYFKKFFNKNKKEIETVYNIIYKKLNESVFNVTSVSELILHLEMDKKNLNKFKSIGFEPNPIFYENSIYFINTEEDSEYLVFDIDFEKRSIKLNSILLTNISIKAKLNEKETTFYFSKLIYDYGYLSNFAFLSFLHTQDDIKIDKDCDFSDMYFYCRESILKKDSTYVLLDILRTYVQDNEKEILDFLICEKKLSEDFINELLLKHDIDLHNTLNKIYIPDINFNIEKIKIDLNNNNNPKVKI